MGKQNSTSFIDIVLSKSYTNIESFSNISKFFLVDEFIFGRKIGLFFGDSFVIFKVWE